MTNRLLLHPSELRRAVVSFLSGYTVHGGDEAWLLEHELTNLDAAGCADPAIWSDWLTAVWSTRGIEVDRAAGDRSAPDTADMETETEFVRLPDGTMSAVEIREMTDSRFAEVVDLRNAADGGNTYSESSGFVILNAYVTWSGWPNLGIWEKDLGRRNTPISMRAMWLQTLAEGKAPQNFSNLWGPLFVDAYTPETTKHLPLWSLLVPAQDPPSPPPKPTD